eukprot:3156954-Rhodomonas_salina.1
MNPKCGEKERFECGVAFCAQEVTCCVGRRAELLDRMEKVPLKPGGSSSTIIINDNEIARAFNFDLHFEGNGFSSVNNRLMLL